MTADLVALGRRAVACKAWRWMPGMAMCDGQRLLGSDANNEWAIVSGRERAGPNGVPDLSDPATLGCLLALVREARSDMTLYVEPCGDQDATTLRDQWQVMFTAGAGTWYGGPRTATEADALVAALEAAP